MKRHPAGGVHAGGLAMMRAFVRLLQLAGLLGMGLSLLALGLAVYLRVDWMLKRPPGPGGFDTAAGLLTILDAFKEPGVAFLLATLLFVVCEIAARLIPPAQQLPHDPDRDYNSPP